MGGERGGGQIKHAVIHQCIGPGDLFGVGGLYGKVQKLVTETSKERSFEW